MQIEMRDGKPSSLEADARQAANVDAAWTLVRWVGIPIVLVAALYFVQRGLDERPYVVVTDHGAMPSADRIAVQPSETPSVAPPSPAAPLYPTTPPPAAPTSPATGDVVLRALSQPSPPYPARALQAEKEGIVRLRLTIAPDGHVSDAVIIEARPRGWFEEAAANGVKRWRYSATGRVASVDVDVEFKLN